MKLSNKTITLLLFFTWIVLMVIGYVAEQNTGTIFFYIFALCYFIGFIGTNLMRYFKNE